jgi:diadenosine tetraphosphatase ApaH/serine/threonine PP2A family protein phosphatase
MQLGPERLIINPGSVGQPRDGDRRASYIVLDQDAMTIEHRRVSYDVKRTQDAMQRYGLPERQAARLSYGW